MNSNRSFPKRARALAQLAILAIATLALASACGNDTIPEGSASGGKGATPGSAGKAGKAGSGMTDDAGAAGTDEAGEGGMPSTGGMPSMGGKPGVGGMPSVGGSTSGGMGGMGITGTAGGAQGGSSGAGPVCGNNKVEAGEECDDGNTKDWDGCSSTCKNKCEQCEKQLCATNASKEDYFLNCYTEMGSISNPSSGLNLALQGPAQGQPKQQLCAKLVECLQRTQCIQDSPNAGLAKGCFCGASTSPADCADPQKGPKGPCVAEVGAAAESMALSDVSKREINLLYAAGIARKIVTSCTNDACPAECLKGKSLSACERCTFGDVPFNQFNGAGGDYFHCYFQPPAQCASAVGQATSTCPAATCAPAADCALATHCATNAVTDCYGPTGQGPCAAQFAAAAGSTDPATVLDRLTNGGDYASALLVSLLENERQPSCKSTCFPGSGGGGSGGSSAGANAGTGG